MNQLSDIKKGTKWVQVNSKELVTVIGVDGLNVDYQDNMGVKGKREKEWFLSFYEMVEIDGKLDYTKTIKAHEICQQAIDTMIERGKNYDKDNQQEERSMGKTVTAFNALTGQNLTETQGWLFMAVLKMARSQQGEYKHDNFLDGTAYFALAGESASAENG